MNLVNIKKKTLIVLRVKEYARINIFRAQYIGEVHAPAELKGQEVIINLTDYKSWKLSDNKTPQEIVRQVEAMGEKHVFEYLTQLEEDATAKFESLSKRNSLIVFKGCIRADDPGAPENLWGSWDGDFVGTYPNNDVLTGYARLQKKINSSGASSLISDFLNLDKARLIKSFDDFRDFYIDFISPAVDGFENNANCLFLIKSSESADVVKFWAYCARKELSYMDGSGRVRLFKVPASFEQTWDESVVQGIQSKGLCRIVACALSGDYEGLKKAHAKLAMEIADGLKAGSIHIEAIPGQRLRMIGETLKTLDEKGSHLNESISKCIIEGAGDIGFYPMVAVINKSKPASAKVLKEQLPAIVVNRIYHEDDKVAVGAEGLPVDVKS